MKIKVCGMREPGNINAVVALKPDYLGFICYAPSPRFIGDIDTAVLNDIPQDIIKTAVFVNEKAENINLAIEKYRFTAVQLHGNETPELCRDFKSKVIVIKAFGVDEVFDFKQLLPYVNYVDYFLFDTKTVAHGGSGKTFDWGILDRYDLEVPFFLSGGISTDNIADINKLDHPQLYGVDLNSRFELSPGLKNTELLKNAFEAIKK